MRAAIACMALLLGGCPAANVRLETYDPQVGYRADLTTEGPENSDSVYIAMSFSGGGTRAAALSYGALRALRDHQVPIDGAPRPLTAEVDLISSVSGGSFTSAYFGLFGDDIFKDFEARVLRRNLEWAVIGRMFIPWNALRLMSRVYDRVHLAQSVFDATIFDGKTFAAMETGDRKPFVIINGTNISQGQRFAFTQERFDTIGSNLSVYPVGFAVAASAAFPPAFNPVLLFNHRRPKGLEAVPEWVLDGEKKGALDPAGYRRALEWRRYADKDQRPYAHITDGGLADNTGLRAIISSLQGDTPPNAVTRGAGTRSIKTLINRRKIERLLVVVVNAKPAKSARLDRLRTSPGVIDMVTAAGTTAMDNYTDDAVGLLDLLLRQAAETAPGERAPPLGAPTACSHRVTLRAGRTVAYIVDVSFARVPDPKTRKALETTGTRLTLADDEVDRLIEAGQALVTEDPCFKAFLADTGGGAVDQGSGKSVAARSR